ncbi:MAG: lipopolysaccharide heptosyltransferase II [Acidobacteria bacterium]|nr:MAG: lipopolysaccharide heptosyltransferase II [Acidobacteriota bacterium]
MSRKVFIRSTNWIGDAVMSVAALRELRRLYPQDHLVLAARPWVAGLFENQGLVDEVVSIETTASRLKNFRHTVSVARSCDQAVLLQNALGAALVVFTARIPDRAGYRTDGRSWLLTRSAVPRIKRLGRHQMYYYLDLLYQTGLSSTDYLSDSDFRPDISLVAGPQSLADARRLLTQNGIAANRPVVGVNPGAFFGSAKRWFPDRYAAVADMLIQRLDAQILIFGSPQERRLADEICERMRYRPVVLAGATSLPSLMALISLCNLFITNDSGPMHLAAALGTTQIALFGSTDEIATGPYSPKATVVHKHVECSPCLLRECPLDLRCFERIEVDEVYELARTTLTHG